LLWYGYFYYLLTLLLLALMVSFFLRLTVLNIFAKINFVTTFYKCIAFFFTFFALGALALVFTVFDLYSNFNYTPLTYPLQVAFFDYIYTASLVNFYALELHLTSVYVFPFIYIFILITTISVLYCLTYNLNEIAAFMFYTFFILVVGYVLFFTDSLLLFFFAYECLLVPSFFILYNFAKTRRCVEAAYLMFFWTQFGAMFLIFSLLYLFLLTGTSSFYNVTLLLLTPFEVNFLFACWFVGFGVKLPI
jgi:NADH:ubiquinone oxidoreductase subunit 4 (subunit M)